MLNKVYIGVGTNLGDKPANIERAYQLIGQYIGDVLKKSSMYTSEPWGFVSENDFINTMIIVNTDKSQMSVLEQLKMIESEMGRVQRKTEVYESRIIDLDIIAFNQEIFEQNELIIPHQHLQNRNFVLEPLNEIDNEWVHPVSGKSISDLILNSKDDSKIFKIT